MDIEYWRIKFIQYFQHSYSKLETWVKRSIAKFDPFFKHTPIKLPLLASHSRDHTYILLSSLCINLLALAFPMMLLQTYDRIIPNKAFSTLSWIAIGLTVVFILENLLKIIRSYLTIWTDAKLSHQLSQDTLHHILDTPLSKHQTRGPGEYLDILNSIQMMRDFHARRYLFASYESPFILLFLGLIAYIAGWLVIAPLVTMLLYAYIMLHDSEKAHILLQKKIIQDSHTNNFLIEMLENIHTVKSMAVEAQMIRRYERLEEQNITSRFHQSVHTLNQLAIKLTASQVTMVAIVCWGSIMVIHDNLTIGGLASCILLSNFCFQPLTQGLTSLLRLRSMHLIEDNIRAILDLPDESEKPNIGVITGEIECQNMSFRYPKEKKFLLKDINLKVAPQETIAIIGPSHAGKTILINLLYGLLPCTEGKILLDGKNIHTYHSASWRKQISYLPQRGKLFRGTIIENLALYQKHYYKRAKELANLLGLDAHISHLPDGYNTLLGEHAIQTLPKGLVQLILIIRGLLKKPKIIIFDEANENLSIQNDRLLKRFLKELKKTTTLIIISHRPSTLTLADKVYLLKDGTLRLMENDYGS